MSEEAKAVTAIAVATGKVVDAGAEFGRFVGRVLGTVPQDAVGVLVGDWLHEVRIRNVARLQQRTEEILSKRGQGAKVEAVSPTLAIPLFKSAQDESDVELQELWARLLANAMDGSRPAVRRTFIETLHKFDSTDAIVFARILRWNDVREWVVYDGFFDELGISKDSVDVSLAHMRKLDVIEHLNYQVNGAENQLRHMLLLSAYGRELARALTL